MDTSVDGSKKLPLEDLSKDELIKKCRGLLTILQKAKQSKDALIEENNKLKSETTSPALNELLENLTQQKLDLVTSLEQARSQNDVIHNKLKDCQLSLSSAEGKIAELDTANEGYQRQVKRLTEDNDQLLTHLDALEKQTEELRTVGLQQQQQLLELEKHHDASSSESTELEQQLKLVDTLRMECEEARRINGDLEVDNKALTEKHDELVETVETLRINCKNAEVLVGDLKAAIQEKNKQNEAYLNTADDLNTELHKNKALVEKLQQDVANMSSKLSNSQIVSSGVASDLQNTNEKLRDKLKFFRSKIIKFAGDVKVLKQQKAEVLDDLRSYVRQVKLWEAQLKEFSTKVLARFKQFDQEKSQLECGQESYKLQMETLQAENSHLKTLNCELTTNLDSLQSKIIENDQTLDNKRLTEEINISIKHIQDLKNQLEALEKERDSFKEQSDALTSELKILSDLQQNEKELRLQDEAEKHRLKTEIQQLVEKNHELTQTNQQKLEDIKNLNQNLIEKSEELENRLYDENNLKIEITNLREATQKFTKDLQSLTEANEGLRETIRRLEDESQDVAHLNKTILDLQGLLDVLKATEVKLAEQSANEITKLVQESRDLSEVNRELEKKLLATQTATNDCGSQANGADDQVSIVRRENAELLTEMNEMNQVLKERGETISKQQEYCEELLRNIKVYEAQATKFSDMVRQKEEIINKLENDVSLLKDQSVTQSAASFNEGHATIIKKDEEITQLRNELSILKDKLNSPHLLDSSHEANYAESETMSTSTISRTEDISRLKDLEGSWEERYGKLRSLAIKLKGKIRDLTAELGREQNEKADAQQKLANSSKTVQTLQGQCDKLQDELEQGRREVKEYSKKLDLAALDISNSKKQLASYDEVIVGLKADIDGLIKEKANMDNWKKQVSSKVQNLKKELEANNVLKKDFESQISKLTAQLEAKEKQLKDEMEKHNTTRSSLQESHNECKKQSVLNLEMQDYERSLRDLTQKLDKKQELITKLKNQVDGQKSTVSSVKEQNRLLEERIQSEETDLSGARGEIQAYKKSISDLEAVVAQKDDKLQDLTRALEGCRAENEDLSTQLSKIVAEHQKSFSGLKSEKDYLRSQNLGLEQRLRQTEDGLRLKEDELKEMRAEYHGYKVRAQSVLRQNQTRDVGLEEKLSEEAASFKAQATVLTSELNELRVSLEMVKDENTNLKVENEQVESKRQYLELELEARRKQQEVFAAKHQKTIAEHAETVRGLKVHAETLAQCYRQQVSDQEVRHNREIIELQSKIEKVVPAPEVPQLAPPTVPREQGEGSESVDAKHSINTHPVPLDRLLSSEYDQDVGFVRKQLSENEAKVTHLTALLADTEQDLVKHVQMNKLLKEEIRRQQRSVEREKHAENLEYLKNVVFKFATLGSGDERSRLVPVLNTILKFSPEETSKLNMVARGDLGGRGWANYLPTWPVGKPQ